MGRAGRPATTSPLRAAGSFVAGQRIGLGLCLVRFGSCASRPTADPARRAAELAREFLIVDGHIDVPYRLHTQRQAGSPLDDVTQATAGGDFDYPRAIAGGLDAPFLSIYTPSEDEQRGVSKQVADELIDLVEDIARRAPEKFALARTAAQVRAAAASGRIALLLGMENGSPLEGRLENLEHFFQRGVRYITLTHGQDNHICDSSYDTRHTHGGLSPFGRVVVRRMNELGILIDLSHVSDDTFWQVLELTRAPAIASHSSLRHFVPGFERNMSDDMLRALARNGGVIQINFGSGFLTRAANEHYFARVAAGQAFAGENDLAPEAEEVQRYLAEQWDPANPFPRADVTDVADHIDHAVQVAGIDHVGLGSDFDGVGDTLPTGLKDVSEYPNLLAELLRRGYSERDIEKICGTNVLRVMERCERVARELSAARP
jgi:membrane dipeptidase